MRDRAEQQSLWPDPSFDGRKTRQFRQNIAYGFSLQYSRWACSPAHYRQRYEVLARQGFRCAECGEPLDSKRFDTHHWNSDYSNLGYEEASDLGAVHRAPCHRRLHERKQGC